MDKTPTYHYRLKALLKALNSFENTLRIDLAGKDETEEDAIRNGQALKFGYSVELLWKVIKSFLYEVHGAECSSPKSCIKSLFQNSGLSEEDYQKLIEMVNQRNELAHIYDEQAFDKIWKSLPSNLEVLKKCAGIMEGYSNK